MVHPRTQDQLGLRERKKRHTRLALATAAVRLFTTRGYEATTIDHIAAAAGVSTRTFFSYFASKDDVVFADFDERLTRVWEALDDAEPAGETLLDRIRRILRDVFLAALEGTGEYEPIIIRLVLERPELQAKVVQRFVAAENEAARRLVRLSQGAIDELTAHALAGTVGGGLRAVGMYCMMHELDPDRIRAEIDRTLTMIEEGIGALPALTQPAAEPR